MAFSLSSLKVSSITKYFKNLSTLDLILFALIVLYLIFDVRLPHSFDSFLLSPLGMIVLLLIPFVLFLYVNPIVGILSLFMVHKILSDAKPDVKPIKTELPAMNPNTFNKQSNILASNTNDNVATNPVVENHIITPNVPNASLEEDVVGKMAPIGVSDPNTYIKSSYKPIVLDDHSAASPY
jgi:hypothetical protein